ncbi:SAVED domain-containing protein [Rhizobium bangladeshense]|uniref:SAVED domain-containing protein n=1 Tax=Rhizobium bangladeshense TaxID=1138189 RepID=UPI001A99F1A2|nr:SAVED domain-containing protein [Rhizobium bangladeshense]QSY96044.1 SAVED domain-containing protein [Rhizobium bangladeshense]
MYRQTLDWGLREFVKFLFRPRGFEGKGITASAAILVAIFGGNFLARLRIGDDLDLQLTSTNIIPDWVQWPTVAICIAVFVSSVLMGWKRFNRENEIRNRKKVIVVEGRGLREDDGAPLAAAVPSDIVGQRIPVMLDLRQRRDGVIVAPDELLPEVNSARRSVQQFTKQNDRQDVTVVYGGLTPVPMTFLTGVIFDDEGSIVVMDWDRTAEKWRPLDGEDDGQRFRLEGLEEIDGADEVVLAVSASYEVRTENVATSFDLPVVRLGMADLASPHWSQAKQSALSQQVFDTARLLEARGVTLIHLILAAQNSVAFNLGRRYDKRNLPNLVVYQFEAGSERKYPWGVRMPVRGVVSPEIVRNDNQRSPSNLSGA